MTESKDKRYSLSIPLGEKPTGFASSLEEIKEFKREYEWVS